MFGITEGAVPIVMLLGADLAVAEHVLQRGGLNAMFDEQTVTTGEEIAQAREAPIELGKDIARRW
jgi:hypothetical protein